MVVSLHFLSCDLDMLLILLPSYLLLSLLFLRLFAHSIFLPMCYRGSLSCFMCFLGICYLLVHQLIVPYSFPWPSLLLLFLFLLSLSFLFLFYTSVLFSPGINPLFIFYSLFVFLLYLLFSLLPPILILLYWLSFIGLFALLVHYLGLVFEFVCYIWWIASVIYAIFWVLFCGNWIWSHYWRICPLL